ncbi:MAG: hypothetical protein GAK41_00969 [Burkholderia gladioli]|nr:MAG: hypothetical protein GAK41_00969 [Burkholderia gladioli]
MRVRSWRTVCNASALAPTTMSQASSRSACCVSMRTWFSHASRAAIRTYDSTAPPFCAKPMKSSTDALRPSRCAAMLISAPTVTTPVPPTPVTSMSYGAASSRAAGSGSAATRAASAASSNAMPTACFSAAPSTVTKLGQKPFTHE